METGSVAVVLMYHCSKHLAFISLLISASVIEPHDMSIWTTSIKHSHHCHQMRSNAVDVVSDNDKNLSENHAQKHRKITEDRLGL
jgi:hypothetical protein